MALIREALSSDAEAIRRIAEGAYAIYVERLGRPPAPMVADFERHIEQDWVIIDYRDGRISGYAILATDERRALLDNIAVDPTLRRSGIGRALIDRVEQRANELGYDSLELYTNIVMTENVTWYKKLGFIETRRVVENGFHRVYMKKTICPEA